MNKLRFFLCLPLALALAACGRPSGAILAVSLPTLPVAGHASPALSVSGHASPAPSASPSVFPDALASDVPSTAPSAMPERQPSLTLQDQIPHFTSTGNGAQGDPVALLVAGTQPQVEAILTAAGWLKADALSTASSLRMVKADLTGSDYPTAPVSNLYLYNQVQAVAYERGNVGIRSRDHLRIWQSPLQDLAGRTFFAIATTKDVGVKWINHHPTHRIGPNVDAERDLVLQAFTNSGQIALQYDLQYLSANYQGMNGEGDTYYSDGRQIVMELNDAVASPVVAVASSAVALSQH